MQRAPFLQNPIYPRNITKLTDFTDFTDLQPTDLWPAGCSYNHSYDFFSGCRVAAPPCTRVSAVGYLRRCIFSYPRHRAAAQTRRRGMIEAEKYTARRDLTADGVDFESLYGFDE